MSTTGRQAVKQHPLQRLKSPSRGLSALLHSVGIASFIVSFNYLTINPSPVNEAYGWHMQYLTIIGLSLATLTFTVGLLADLTLSPLLFSIKNVLSVASAPMEVLISLLYWTIRTIDVRLVMPDWAPRLPLSADLGFHAMPAIALVLDLLLFSPPYAISAVPAFGLSGLIAVGYWFWIDDCYKHNGFYPYPLFDEIGSTSGRVALFAGSALVMTCSTFCLQWLYSTVNGRVTDRRQRT